MRTRHDAVAAEQLLDYLGRHTATADLARQLDDVVQTRRRLQTAQRRQLIR